MPHMNDPFFSKSVVYICEHGNGGAMGVIINKNLDAPELREILKEVARVCEKRISLSPKISPNAVGNGVHIHLSLLDRNNRDISQDPNKKGELSKEFSSFCAGILNHINSVTAMSAPSTISYLRLLPHNWSASYNTISMQDREAAIRLCPEFYFNRKKIRSIL